MVYNDNDFIWDLVETRVVTDEFASILLPAETPIEDENDVPEQDRMAFAYSLFYVYYDQYTYIKGILLEDSLLAIAAVLISIEIITNLGIALFVALNVFLVSFNLLGFMWLTNQIFAGYDI